MPWNWTWATPGLLFGQSLWSVTAFVNKLVPCAWQLSGALQIWRLWLRLWIHFACGLFMELTYGTVPLSKHNVINLIYCIWHRKPSECSRCKRNPSEQTNLHSTDKTRYSSEHHHTSEKNCFVRIFKEYIWITEYVWQILSQQLVISTDQ